MASDKFGSNPVAPLYNATGRNPRDVEMGTPGKPLGSVGSSGAGGKDFGISGKAPEKVDLTRDAFSPFNPYNIMLGRGGLGRGRGRGGGGGEVEYDIDAMERIAKAQTPGVVQFGDANTGTINDYSQNKRAVNSKIDVTGDQNIANAQNQYLTNTPTSAPAPAQPNKPARVKTTEQRERDRETAKARRALKSDIQKSGTPEQKERIAKEGITGRKNAKPKAGKPTPVSSTGSVEMTQSIGNLKNKMAVGGNFS